MMHTVKGLKGIGLLSLICLAAIPVLASAQGAYPSRPVDIIVPYGPGGSTDLSTRMLAEFVKNKHQVIVNVINKPGGSAVPASLDFYKAKPDGYTLFADCTSTNITMEIAIKDLPFKVMERTFVGSHSASPYIITVPAASPHKTLQDLFDDLKSKPEEFTYVSAGALANHDVIFRQAAYVLKVDPLKSKPIVVSGAAQAAVVTAQNSVKMGGGTIASQLTAIKAGTIRAVAVCGNQRWEDLPDVPTTAELGYPTITYDQWNGISGPPKMSADVIKVWEGYIQEMAKDPGIAVQLKATGARPQYLGSEQLRQQVQKTGDEMHMLWK